MLKALMRWWRRLRRRSRRGARPRRPDGETLYDLVEPIGEGGMGVVWKARRKGRDEIVAVKVLNPDSARLIKRYRKQFRAHEGNIALKLDHPNIVRTFDYGRWGRRCYYIAQEYVEGLTLARMIEHEFETRVVPIRIELLTQIADGLSYVHRQGLIHRDFGPKNVIVSDDGVPRIIDFGLTIPAEGRQRVGRDRAGTASYMAPEQVRRLRVDVRTDVYAFGLTAFQILSGRRAYAVSNNRRTRMELHLNVEPQSLSELAPDVPPALARVVHRCIEKDPHLRYNSMDEVIDAIEKALSGGAEEHDEDGPPGS